MSTTVGILAAAGLASRFGGIAKFMLPIPGSEGFLLGRHARHLLNAADQVVVATRSELAEFVRGVLRTNGLESVMVIGLSTETNSETILRTVGRFHASNGAKFIVGLPDAYIAANDHYLEVQRVLHSNPGTVVLGLAPLDPIMRGRLGQVSLDGQKVLQIIDKDPMCPHQWVWGTVGFGKELIPYIKSGDPHIGYAVRDYLADGKPVMGVPCLTDYIDCGMPADYFALIHKLVSNGI